MSRRDKPHTRGANSPLCILPREGRTVSLLDVTVRTDTNNDGEVLRGMPRWQTYKEREILKYVFEDEYDRTLYLVDRLSEIFNEQEDRIKYLEEYI